MITRHNLAEQLREYQIRSKHDWASASFFSSTTAFTSRVDIVIFVIWELVIVAFLVLSAVSLYFRHMRLAFILVCITLLLLVCMKIAKQISFNVEHATPETIVQFKPTFSSVLFLSCFICNGGPGTSWIFNRSIFSIYLLVGRSVRGSRRSDKLQSFVLGGFEMLDLINC
ncbi:hypothetical protein Dimus_034475 [Dionaea muscipula]